MKKTFNFTKLMSVIICLVLTAAMALIMTACGDADTGSSPDSSAPTASDTASDAVKVIGEGNTTFSLKVTDGEGNTTDFTVKTDKKTVGDALLELKLIEGDEGDYGLYIKKVNGITADFDTNGTYWGFFINGEYATSGVDTTEITEGAVYELKVSK